MIGVIIASLVTGALVCTAIAQITGLTTARTAYGFHALTNGALAVNSVITGVGITPINAALSAVFAWMWWRSGGGGGTRHRLRSVWQEFVAVRRTAPVHAS